MSPGGPPLVLVVDDDPLVRRVVRTVLETDGMAVEEATDGRGALEAAQAKHPSVVVLDLLLPGEDGVELCRRLSHGTRVVVLTARDDPAVAEECARAGAAAFLVKPFGSAELASLIGGLVAVD